jgi:nucleoside-diphosphate-sugar epimerase
MKNKKTVLITGGAGFIGSNLCEKFIEEDWNVIAVDNSITGTIKNFELIKNNPNFNLIEKDVSLPLKIPGKIDLILHLASLASPVKYVEYQIETLWAGSLGTFHTLDLAKEKNAVYLLSSSSEVYGDPKVYPQNEDYWGNVNPIGPRSMYDESKRFAEAAVMAYYRSYNVDTRIIRLFNVYGPKMKIDDGRVVCEFIRRAINKRSIQIYGDGTQTRSLCYIKDTIDAIWLITQTNGFNGEVFNVGNPDEKTMIELAKLVLKHTESKLKIEFLPKRTDDPQRRCPDISKLHKLTGWSPKVNLSEGVKKTIEYYKNQL